MPHHRGADFVAMLLKDHEKQLRHVSRELRDEAREARFHMRRGDPTVAWLCATEAFRLARRLDALLHTTYTTPPE